MNRDPSFHISFWRIFFVCLAMTAIGFESARSANADELVFVTESSFTQSLASPFFGGNIDIAAFGLQTYTVDVDTGFANVESLFQGNDLPDPLNPGEFLNYDLYNTATTGSIVENVDGFFDIQFSALFELRVTSGLFTGFTFETLDFASFDAIDIDGVPFPPGTLFYSPDSVDVFVQFDPTFTFPPGELIGESFERRITIQSVVPEPTSMFLLLLVTGFLAGSKRR